MSDLKIGDLVIIKPSSPQMVITHIGVNSCGKFHSRKTRCECFNILNNVIDVFYPFIDSLEKV
jgi:hypothetical protein